MAIETNLNQSPFFDDFDEKKNFHRVLFRPGFAVQARELTQLQTILQNQIERFANEVLVDGTVVTGVGLKTDTIDFVKLRDKDANNRVMLLGDFFSGGAVANAIVVGETTDVTAQLIDAKEGSEAADPNFLSLFVKYTNSTNKITGFNVSSTADADAGTGYSNGDVIKVDGGVGVSANATVTTGLSNTSVVSLTVVNRGLYTTFPSLTGTTTTAETGSGTGLKVDLTTTSFKQFADNEVLNVRWRANNSFIVAANTITASATGKGFRATVSDGIVYHKGHFIRVAPQSHIVEKYSTTPNKKIGFITAESTVDSNEDSSLLDNSTGSTNFAAPGAERLKLSPTLSSRSLTAANTTTFFTIATVESGEVVQRRTDTVYSDLGQYIAQRQFETNGNYAIEPFNIRIREHLRSSTNLGRYNSDGGGDTNKLVAEVEKGIGYVGGNRVSLESPIFRDVDKATQYEVKETRIIGQSIGNFVIAKEVVGTWEFQQLSEVSLRDAVQNGVSGKNYGDQAAQGSEIGTAKVRGISYESGATGTVEGRVRLYIFDIQMNTGKSFDDVRGIHVVNAGAPNSMADLVLESGKAVLKESGKNILVFPFTQKGTKTLKNSGDEVTAQFVFRTDKEDVEFPSSTAQVTGLTPDAKRGGGEEAVSPLDSGNRNVFVVTLDEVDTVAHTGTISDISGNTVQGSATTFSSDYTVGDMIKIVDGVDTFTEIVSEITSDTQLQTIDNFSVSRSGVSLAHATRYPTGRIFNSEDLTVSRTPTALDITVTPLVGCATSFTADVYFDIVRSGAVQTAKTVNKSKYVHIDTGDHSASKNGPWSLGVSDAFKLEAVYVGGNTTVTASNNNITEFELVTGQKDAYYDTSSLKLKDTSTLDLTNRGLLVKFSYFDRDYSAGIGYLSVDSYPVDDANPENADFISTQDIPIFTSPTTGVEYDLRDAVDFRPIKQNSRTPSANAIAVQTPSITNPDANTTFFVIEQGAYMPTPDENFQTGVQFYLPRKDRVVMTKEGNVEVIKGVPSLTPKTPAERGESMSLGTLDIPVYPSLSSHVAKQANRPDYAVRLTLDNNRRFTMKDLRAVEERVKNLEYYASLNALETSAKNKQIFGTTGIDRFKNGFLVDNFDGHNRADTSQVGYRAAIDRNRNELRPSYVRRDISMTKDLSFTSSNITKRGNLVTLSFTDTSLLNQPFASKLRNPVQELTFNWRGEVLLNPSMDNTPDITTLPDIQVDFDGMNQAFEEIASATGVTGIDWGNWTTTSTVTDTDVNRSGRRTTTTTTTTTSDQIRQGIQTSISPSGELFSVGNFVENVAVRDFMRSRNVQVTGVRMKPSTRVYPYFDDELVADFVTPTNSSFANTAAEGSPLITDSTGTVYANFRIPNDDTLKFRVGTKRFEFKDIANTQTQSSLLTTSAHGDYTSTPLSITQRGTSFINLPQISKQNVTDDRTLRSVTTIREREDDGNRDDDNPDPLSQTFTISAGDSEGVFITKLDLYFGRKSSTYPITVQIREVENGFPTPTIMPFGSKTLQPSEVSANSAGTGGGNDATTFQFDSPLFLKNGTDYAFTIIPGGNSDEYALWVGELGGTDVDTNELIHKQPASGILFSSANDKTWSPIQSEDIKFNLYRANFTTSAGTVYVENDDIEFFSYSTLDGTFNIGEKVTNGIDPTPASGFVKFIDTANKKIHIENSTGGFGAANTITGAVSGATAQLSSIDNIVMNTLVPKLPAITYANTFFGLSARTTSGIIGTSFVTVDNEVENDFLDSEKKIFSKTNESGLSAVDGSQKSLVIKGTISTSDPKVSPVIDTARTNGIVIENVINNLITDEQKTVGDANMRYITKPVELADGQDAEDLKVFLTAYKPSTTGIAVYARIHNPEDGENFSDKDFTPLTQITASNTFSDSVDRTDFKEFEFGFSANTDGQGFLTTANSHARLNTSDNDIVTYRATDGSIYATYKTFALKIVMTSTGTNIVPLVKDMRAIALQK